MPPKKASKKDAAVVSAAEAAPSSPAKPVTADTPPSPSKSPEKPAKKKPAAKKAPSTEKPVKEKKEAKPKAPKADKEEKPKAAAKKTTAAATKKKPAKKEEEPTSSSGAESSSPAKKKSASSGAESSPKKAAGEASPKKKPAAKKRTKSEGENGGSSSPAKKAKKAAAPKKTDKAEKAAAKPKTKKTPTKGETGGESSAAEGAGTPAKKKRPAKKKAEADTENGGNASPAPKKAKKKAAPSKEGEAGGANKSEGEATPAKEKKPTKPRARKPKPVEDDAPVVGQRKNFQPLPTAMPKLLKKTIAPRNRTKPPTSGEEEAASGAEEESVEKNPSKSVAGGKKLLNATETDWENQNFQINSGFKLKVASWNVSGLRAWLEKGGRNYIMHERPDIVCLQETKCKPDVIPPEATISGYHPYWLGFSGHAGVGIYSRQMPLNVTYGIGDKEMDEEGRMLTAEYEKFFLVNTYVPNAGRKLVTLPKRLRWNKLFKEYIQALDRQKAVIICGDMNVAHEEIDLANPKTNKKNAGFTQEERDGMTDFLESCQFVDTFRHFYPKEKDAYTFWTYMSNARAKNVGWRLDYILVSQRIVTKVVDNKIRSRVFGSDHCPIVGFFNL